MIHQVNRAGLKIQMRHITPGDAVVVHGQKHTVRSVAHPLRALLAVAPDIFFAFEDGGGALERNVDTIILADGEIFTVYAYGKTPT